MTQVNKSILNFIVNPIISSKHRLHAKFCSTMMKYTFTLPPPKLGVKVKSTHGQTTVKTDKRI